MTRKILAAALLLGAILGTGAATAGTASAATAAPYTWYHG